MKHKLTLIIAAIFFAVASFSFVALPTHAAPSSAQQSICGNENIPPEIRSSSGCDDEGGELPNVVINIVNIIITLISIIAVIAIIFGGVQYMTSAGDPGKLKKAKDIILYAVIGLAVCILAAIIVNFVIDIVVEKAVTATSTS